MAGRTGNDVIEPIARGEDDERQRLPEPERQNDRKIIDAVQGIGAERKQRADRVEQHERQRQ
ncbi:hypothetical protein J2R87_006301 [Bradyrhizobium elkanii]|nr:hypothetical protein [Bradyrhizobium elkanii]